MKTTGLLAAVFGAVLTIGAPTELRAADDDLAFVSGRDADPAQVAETLGALAQSLSFGEMATQHGRMTLVMPGTVAERTAQAARYANVFTGAAAVLAPLGLVPLADAPALTVVHVRAKGGRPFAVWAATGAEALAVREVDGLRLADPPGPPTRADGRPMLRDAVEASRRARLWVDAARSTSPSRLGGPGSATFELARKAVVVSLGGVAAPNWFVDGLAGWVETQVAKPASHICRPYTAARPEILASLLDDAAPRSPAATRFLSLVVGALVTGRTDVARCVEALGAKGGTFEKAFGVTAADLVAKACAGLEAADRTCDEDLTVGCPVCGGDGKLQLDCPECEGSGNEVCPSCRGRDWCRSPCIAGIFFIGYSEVKCKLCTKGKVRCSACNGSLRASCKACGGTKSSVFPCLVCREGRLPCPDSGVAAAEVAPETACPWCRDPARKFACPDCGGAGYAGCDACNGTLKVGCSTCSGAGEVPYALNSQTYGSFIVSRPCGRCDGIGFSKCTTCTGGKRRCTLCQGKKLRAGRPEDCPACVQGVLPTLAELPSVRPLASAPLDAMETAAVAAMVQKGVDFLLTCRDPRTSAFCIRDNRAEGQTKAGELEAPYLLSNAITLWCLAMAGVDTKERRVAGAWHHLRVQAQEDLAEGTRSLSQGTALSLRALVLSGEDPKGPLVVAIVKKIADAQHANGWWSMFLDPKGKDDDDLASLMIVESLRMARIKGAAVPKPVWDKALRASSAAFDSKGPKSSGSDTVYGTSVLSNLAMIVMAKEGTLGSKATAFDYLSMPQVKKGLAWLDRYFDVRWAPQLVKGSRVRTSSDAGHAAYIFAVQRLAMLLNIEVLADDRWHAAGARRLIPLQYEDGSFEERSPGHPNGPVRTTVCYLLFLLRATAPITDSKDD